MFRHIWHMVPKVEYSQCMMEYTPQPCVLSWNQILEAIHIL